MTKVAIFRPEIQGLRAIAVLAVMLFHVWPLAVPGGYVGVDVFFVISGYLITGLLLREAERGNGISIGAFYARRIKRLLPAATVVLLAVTTCISILPIVRWHGTAMEAIASGLYFENWWLAGNAVNYLALDDAPSALQHYWSLSVEEQYYIFWPILLAIFAGIIPIFRRRPRMAFGVLVGLVGGLSLAYSIYITPRNPGLAYFATTTRAWELAIGGALAVSNSWQSISEWPRRIAGYAGVSAIVLAGGWFSTKTYFPGFAALLPTVGAALVIVSGSSSSRLALYQILKSRPLQYVGDLSYSMYLWHWPVLVFYMALSGHRVGLIDGLVILAVSTALAHQTKSLVEDRFRSSSFASSRRWMPFAFGLLCIGLTISFACTVLRQAQLHASANNQTTQSSANHPGALELTKGANFDSNVPFLPTALTAVGDKGRAYQDGCIAGLMISEIRQCRYGAKQSALHMVVVGDSHAVQWLPALVAIAKQRGWMLTVITKSACSMAALHANRRGPDERLQSCLVWGQRALTQVKKYKPQVVIFAESISSSRAKSTRQVEDRFIAEWQQLEAAGSMVIAIHDTPKFASPRPDCMTGARATISSCSRLRSKAMGFVDPLEVASRRHPSVTFVDLTDAICDQRYCRPVVGNVFVWRDSHHMTASYVRTLAGPLDESIGPVLEHAASRASSGKTINE